MAGAAPETAPVLSTPETHVFEDPTPALAPQKPLADDQLYLTYEIRRTVDEIRTGRWKRIALQFPDHMLVDAPRVFEALQKELRWSTAQEKDSAERGRGLGLEQLSIVDNGSEKEKATNGSKGDAPAPAQQAPEQEEQEEQRLSILGDTSYGACCVDEVAAEHVEADVVVHYGRTCLSPTARLPVIYVFTSRPLHLEAVVATFQHTYPDKHAHIILMADIPYSCHVQSIHSTLQQTGYTNIFAPEIVHDPSSPIPNRTVPRDADGDGVPVSLQHYSLFHISDPPTTLLLNISSRLASVYICPTDTDTDVQPEPEALSVSTAQTLRRRYALVTKLSTVAVFGILINTLSVKNYMHALSHVQDLISRAGKKYYTFVVGKVNAAKVANFSEVDGWVVIGCWESSLIESKDFWKPIITPFELELALTDERDRIWTGEWNSDFQSLLEKKKKISSTQTTSDETNGIHESEPEENDSDEESEPPVFDLRTGRYVSQSRPMAARSLKANANTSNPTSLVKRANGDLAHIGGQLSLGAEYLRSNRTWQGLGTDYEVAYDYDDQGKIKGAAMEEGRSGVARGYTVGEDDAH